jgi:rhodanese-related sulfurtransferase
VTATTTRVVEQLDAPALRSLLERRSDVLLLDVRSPGEFAGAHVEGSRNLPLDLLEGRAGEVLERVKGPIVAVCSSGVRSQQAARMLLEAGVADVRVLNGGIQAWESTGGDIVRGKGHWAMDRQVRFVAGSLILTGLTLSLFRPRAKWLAGVVGGGLTFSAVTNTCAMGRVLGYLPYNRSGPHFDLEAALASLGG